jgi:hypothetical protein
MIAQRGANGDAVCVLTFHRIVADPRDLFELSWTTFVAILEFIVTRSFHVSAELGPEIFGKCDLVLTFDDATSDHIEVGEALAARGLQGLFFVPTAKLGEQGRLSPQELLLLRSLGHTIGSHGHSHQPLKQDGCLLEEVRGSKTRLEDILGEPVAEFAPPGGIYSRRLVAELRRAGYRAARSLRYGLYGSQSERWRVPSVAVNELSARRGWVHAAVGCELVPAARAVALLKRLVPGGVRAHVGSAVLARMAWEAERRTP